MKSIKTEIQFIVEANVIDLIEKDFKTNKLLFKIKVRLRWLYS